LSIFRKSVEKTRVEFKCDENNGFFDMDKYAFMSIYRPLIVMRNVSDKIVEKILCSVIFFPPQNRAVCDIMWKNIVEPDRP
jgi:hypothetical protein